MSIKLIECIPNFSEGRAPKIITSICEAIESEPDARVLHTTSDEWHNRSVITFVAPPARMANAAFNAIKRASELIDLSEHRGVHPRMGASDVVPFVPLGDASMDDCILISRAVGARVGAELAIPVYLYEYSATKPQNRNLATVRKGGYEAIRGDIEQPGLRDPDFGPSKINLTAGASAIGARQLLIAFNVYIGSASSESLATAKAVAKAIRESNGGLKGLKALGLEVDGQAQVSMNIVDIEAVTLKQAFDAVAAELKTRDQSVEWSEIIGLVPERMNFPGATRYLQLKDSIEDHILDAKLRGAGYDIEV